MTPKLVPCSKHGKKIGVYACHHLMAALHDREPRGINRVEDRDRTVTTWCDSCEEVLQKNGGEWTEEAMTEANLGIICSGCLDDLKTFNTVNELE